VPVLIEAIKEQQQLLEDRDAQIAAQQEQIKAQQQQIAALQENNHKLEARMTVLLQIMVWLGKVGDHLS
jgi:DNA-binding protein H-NS